MTFTTEPKAAQTIVEMMMTSREAFVDYTMPLGLHHLIGGNHYAPMPENAKAQRADWTAVYYHQASADGIGFDRTMKGNQAVGQYFPPVRDLFDNLATCPEKFLLWFHRCGWDYKLKSGKTLWEGLVRALPSGRGAGARAPVDVAVARRPGRSAASQGSRRPPGHPGRRRGELARPDPRPTSRASASARS